MDIELLKTFIEVSKKRHFGRAAEALYLTQSAVSFRIRQLETQLKVNLFTRYRHNIQLTDAGERLLPYAERLIETWRDAVNIATQAPLDENLTIGANAVLWETYLDPYLQKWYQNCQATCIEARIAHRDVLVKEIQERKLDLMLTTDATKLDELICQKVAEISLTLYTSQPHKDGLVIPYLKVDWGNGFSHDIAALVSDYTKPLFSTSSASMAVKLMQNSARSCVLPSSWIKHNPTLKPVPTAPIVNRPIYLVSLYNSEKQEQIKAWCNTLLNERIDNKV